MQPLTLVIHGGAGNIHPGMLTPEAEAAYQEGLQAALHSGYNVLEKGGNAVDAIAQAITVLEDNPIFNAGKGSVFTKKGLHEMDACIMRGQDREIGAIAGVRNVKNPVLLAREVLLHSDHVLLSTKGASEFAMSRHIELAPDDYFFNKERYDQWVEIRDSDYTQLDHKGDNLKGGSKIAAIEGKFGTVGAVACDSQGHIAAATSTGGMTNKRFGRIGDSPIPGAGTYANDATCAISCTGHGEYFLKAVVAYDVSCLIEYKGYSLQQACDTVIGEKLPKLGGEGGLIAVNALGEWAFSFNSAGMFRGAKTASGTEVIAFYGQ
ncbi:MAG: isoaspartyl peptidase/L-asparaginase [Sphingobacteriales bacterium]|nr:MAG: isoaspartyl peptidase/L-asparaginase [Sphingobacteriales bacterium]